MTVAVVGGGASGLVAALTAAQGGNSVVLFEKQPRVGKKLAATGNGRCNLTNTGSPEGHYHGDTVFAHTVLSRFDSTAAIDFFRELGLLTVTEYGGRVYPLSGYAASVVDVLRFAIAQAGVQLRTDCEVYSVEKNGSGFEIHTSQQLCRCDRLVVCCGGAAGAKLGGGKSGYELLRSFGHGCTKLYPSLVQLKTDNTFTRPLKGIRADAAVSLLNNGRTAAAATGEVQFTDYGVSGPAIFELSRTASTFDGALQLKIDLLNGYSLQQAESFITARKAAMRGLPAENLLTGMLHNRLARTLLQYAHINPSVPAEALKPNEIHALAEACKGFILPVSGTLGFDAAQVTAGGICADEFDPNTLQSRLVSGLYAAGEVLDVDGDCGGYNLQWAWASGRLAGRLQD